MFAEFIYRPISGEYKEKHFGNISSDNSWVKFTNDQGEEWVGSFQRGWLDASFFIKPLNKHEKAFVVVGGSAYLIDLNTKEQLNTIEISEIKSAIVDETQRYIYYSNGYDLWFIDIYGVETCLFEYNQHDDFKLTGISNNKLYATCFLYTDNSKQFHIEIDLITKRVHKLDNGKQPVESKMTQNVIKAKPWWKLW